MNEEPEILELSEFLNLFNKESERGAVLIAASRLDEILAGILEAFLRSGKTSKDLLTGFNAPLGTFASRASACHALGLIEDHEFEEITIIRKIRNKFGHEWRSTDFSTDSVRGLTMRLPYMGPPETQSKTSVRGHFTFAVVFLLTDLMWRERLVTKRKIVKPNWPNKYRPKFATPHEPNKAE